MPSATARLGKNRFNYVAAVDGGPFVAAVVEEGQLLVIEAAAVQDRGVDVVDVDLVLDGPQADLVGRAEA